MDPVYRRLATRLDEFPQGYPTTVPTRHAPRRPSWPQGPVCGCSTGGCIGCGVCAVSCPSEAVTLLARPPAEQERPPRNVVGWSFRRALHRSGPWRALQQFGGLAVDAWRARKTGD